MWSYICIDLLCPVTHPGVCFLPLWERFPLLCLWMLLGAAESIRGVRMDVDVWLVLLKLVVCVLVAVDVLLRSVDVLLGPWAVAVVFTALVVGSVGGVEVLVVLGAVVMVVVVVAAVVVVVVVVVVAAGVVVVVVVLVVVVGAVVVIVVGAAVVVVLCRTAHEKS